MTELKRQLYLAHLKITLLQQKLRLARLPALPGGGRGDSTPATTHR